MAKFHINNKDEIKPFKAASHCRFWGNTGFESHFSTKEEAEQALEDKLHKKYGLTARNKNEKLNRECQVIDSLVSDGVSVERIDSLKDYDFVGSSNFSISNVDIVDEKPSKDFLKFIKSGQFEKFVHTS